MEKEKYFFKKIILVKKKWKKKTHSKLTYLDYILMRYWIVTELSGVFGVKWRIWWGCVSVRWKLTDKKKRIRNQKYYLPKVMILWYYILTSKTRTIMTNVGLGRRAMLPIYIVYISISRWCYKPKPRGQHLTIVISLDRGLLRQWTWSINGVRGGQTNMLVVPLWSSIGVCIRQSSKFIFVCILLALAHTILPVIKYTRGSDMRELCTYQRVKWEGIICTYISVPRTLPWFG